MTVSPLKSFVDCLFATGDIVELRLIDKANGSARRQWHSVDALADLQGLETINSGGVDIYVGANPRKGFNLSGDENVALARIVFADFDPQHLAASDRQGKIDEVAARISSAGLPQPTLTIYSGRGVHVYWRFDEPSRDLVWWSDRQRELIALLGSDAAIHNPERIMRAPGFKNWKPGADACEIVEADATRATEWAEFIPLLPARPAALNVVTTAAPLIGGDIKAAAKAMIDARIVDGGDGSKRLFTYACRAVEHGLNDAEAVQAVRSAATLQPFAKYYSDADIIQRVRDAERTTSRGKVSASIIADDLTPDFVSAGDIIRENPKLRDPVIDGILRVGETLNIISAPKVGKSWFLMSLLLSVATGRVFLNKFLVKRSRVLLLDNELHRETLAKRIKTVAEAMGIMRDEYADWLCIESLRGRDATMDKLVPYSAKIGPDAFGLVCIDAFYRTMPKGTDENSNADMTAMFNSIDRIAGKMNAAIVCIHHSSKGNQASKAVTDVGAGAGAQSRAADAHMVMRPHSQDGCVVVEAEVRSFPKMQPFCLRQAFPLWTIDGELNPEDLKRPGAKKRDAESDQPEEPQWTYDGFIMEFIHDTAITQTNILASVESATKGDLSERQAKRWISEGLSRGDVHEWRFKGDNKKYLCNRPQELLMDLRPAA